MRLTSRLMINAPIDNIVNKLLAEDFIRRSKSGKFFPLSKGGMTNLDHYIIVSFYSSKIRGLINYYSFASNYNRLRRILWYLQNSCAYTLAYKYKISAAKVYIKYGKLFKDPDTGIQLFWPNTLKAKHQFNKHRVLNDGLSIG